LDIVDIKYRVFKRTGSCEIKCPVIYPGPMVGSVSCRECDNFVSIDSDKEIVKCKHIDLRSAK